MAEVQIRLDGTYKVSVRAYWGPLVTLVKVREGILFTWSQVKLGRSQNIFNIPVGFTSTLDKIHGARGEFTVKLTSDKTLKRGRFSIIFEGSTMTGLIGGGPKMPSISSKTFKLRVSKLEN